VVANTLRSSLVGALTRCLGPYAVEPVKRVLGVASRGYSGRRGFVLAGNMRGLDEKEVRSTVKVVSIGRSR
jgi:hypothetical protein